jgi:hypothetical protein
LVSGPIRNRCRRGNGGIGERRQHPERLPGRCFHHRNLLRRVRASGPVGPLQGTAGGYRPATSRATSVLEVRCKGWVHPHHLQRSRWVQTHLSFASGSRGTATFGQCFHGGVRLLRVRSRPVPVRVAFRQRYQACCCLGLVGASAGLGTEGTAAAFRPLRPRLGAPGGGGGPGPSEWRAGRPRPLPSLGILGPLLGPGERLPEVGPRGH